MEGDITGVGSSLREDIHPMQKDLLKAKFL